MAVFSGKTGTLLIGSTAVTPVTQWKLTVTSHNLDYAANDTAGWKQRVPGLRDSNGSFEVAADEAGHCPVAEGDVVTLGLNVDSSGNNYYTVPAIIDHIEVDVDLRTDKIVAYAIKFSGNGPVTAHGIVSPTG